MKTRKTIKAKIKDPKAKYFLFDGKIYPHGNKDSLGNSCSANNYHSNGNNSSNCNYCSNGNNWSCGNNYTNGSNNSFQNNGSNGNNWSNGNNCSCGNNSSHCNNWAFGTCFCFGLRACQGAYNSVFCFGKNGIANCLFNKKSTEERCREVRAKLTSFGWFPKWTNMLEIKGNKSWDEVDFTKIKDKSITEAWSSMPREMLEYIKSLPEYDEKIFKEITGQ